jgi:hypothetical protein
MRNASETYTDFVSSHPQSSLPDYHNPDSPTQKRGKGVFRNPVADTWREDAYMKKEPTHQKMTAREASKVQDRWRCEYCGRLNERGIETTTPENPATTELETLRRDTGSIRIGAAGPSRAYVYLLGSYNYLTLFQINRSIIRPRTFNFQRVLRKMRILQREAPFQHYDVRRS